MFVMAACVLSSARAASLVSDLTLSGELGWTDNVTGVGNDQVSETMAAVGIEGRLGADGRRSGITGRVDLKFVRFLGGEYSDRVVGNADLEGHFDLIPETLSWVLEDSFGQTQTDPFAPPTPDSQQNTNFLATGPDLRLEMGGGFLFLGSARYALESYEETVADNERIQATAGLYRELSARSSLGVVARLQDVRFSGSADHDDFSRREYLLRYHLNAPRTTIQADVGQSEFSGDGTLLTRSDMWLYRLDVSRTVVGRASLDFSIGREISDAGDLFATSMDMFSESGNMRSLGLGAVQSIGNGVMATGDALENFFWRVSWRLTRPRSSTYLGVESREERYFSRDALSRDSMVLFAGISRTLATRITASLDLRMSRREAEVTTIKVDDRSATLTGGYSVTPRLNLGASFEYSDRRDNGGGDYDDHRAWLRVTYSPLER